jgi:hypothetical protein
VIEPFEVCRKSYGKKGRIVRDVIGVIVPTAIAQSLRMADPIFVSMGDVRVDWNAPQSPGLRFLLERYGSYALERGA